MLPGIGRRHAAMIVVIVVSATNSMPLCGWLHGLKPHRGGLFVDGFRLNSSKPHRGGLLFCL